MTDQKYFSIINAISPVTWKIITIATFAMSSATVIKIIALCA